MPVLSLSCAWFFLPRDRTYTTWNERAFFQKHRTRWMPSETWLSPQKHKLDYLAKLLQHLTSQAFTSFDRI
jgi:hypothetical protein